MTAASAAARIDHDRIHALYRQVAPGTTAIAGATAGLVVIAMWQTVAHPLLLGWLTVYIANLLVRLTLARAFKLENPAAEARLRVWARRYTLAMGTSGAIFG